MMNLTRPRSRFVITPKLKPYRVQELLFSCLRSKVAYDSGEKIKGYFTKDGDKNVMEYHLIQKYNDDIRVKVDKLITDVIADMHRPPTFYDGMLNVINARDAQGFMLWKKNTIYVTFRGLHDTYDIIDALNLRPKSFKRDMKVHAGFLDQFFAIEPQLSADIADIMKYYPIERLVFAGHSMAGAMAAIAAVHYGNMYKTKHITCHTLGTPMFGNMSFVEHFAEIVDECIRLELEEDIVPTLPINNRFVHLPNGVKLKADGTIENHYHDKLLTYAEVVNRFLKHKYSSFERDHTCERYIERLMSLNHVRKDMSMSMYSQNSDDTCDTCM
jgi:hypothetical protein